MKADRFFVEPLGDAPGNEYRILGNKVQFRNVGDDHAAASAWRTLDGNDVLMHLSLGTAVGEWLMRQSPALHRSAPVR